MCELNRIVLDPLQVYRVLAMHGNAELFVLQPVYDQAMGRVCTTCYAQCADSVAASLNTIVKNEATTVRARVQFRHTILFQSGRDQLVGCGAFNFASVRVGDVYGWAACHYGANFASAPHKVHHRVVVMRKYCQSQLERGRWQRYAFVIPLQTSPRCRRASRSTH